MAPMHSIYNSILCLLFYSQQHCFFILVCSSDMEAFLEFPKESGSGIKDSKTKTSERILQPFCLFLIFSIFICKRVRTSCMCSSL